MQFSSNVKLNTAFPGVTLNPDAPEFCPSGHSPTDSPELNYIEEPVGVSQPFAGPAMSFITTLKPTPTLVPAQAPRIEPQPIFTSLPETPQIGMVNSASFLMPTTPHVQECGGYYDISVEEAVVMSSLYGPNSVGRSMPSSRIFQRPNTASRDEVRDILREMRFPWTVANAIAAMLPDVYHVPLLIYNRFDQLTRTFTIYLKSDEPFPAVHELWNSLGQLPPATLRTFWNKPTLNEMPIVPAGINFHRPHVNDTQPLVGNMQVLRSTCEMQIFTSKGAKENKSSGFKQHALQMMGLRDLDLTRLPSPSDGRLNSELIDHNDVIVIKLGKPPQHQPPTLPHYYSPMPLATSPQMYATSPQVQYVGAPNQTQQAFVQSTTPFQQISI